MRLLVSQHNLGKYAAYYIYKKLLAFKPTESKPFILGLPTGSTPLDMYNALIRLYNEKLISFKHVITFNLDEYVGLPENHPQSYHHYMFNNFFKHVDIKPENIHILNGNAANLTLECESFEVKIKQFGGIDLLLGGVGEDGHIAFNEPGSSLSSTTRVKTLSYSTVLANSRFFYNDTRKTPHLALTVGVKTVLDAKEILILAQGFNKSHAVMQAIEGGISSMCPITSLQLHNQATIVCDEYAAYELKLKTIRYFEQIKDEHSSLEQKLISES